MWPVTDPYVPQPHAMRPLSKQLEHQVTMWSFSGTITVRRGHRCNDCAEQFMMTLKARLFGDDIALSAILASDNPREQKRLERQVRPFYHAL